MREVNRNKRVVYNSFANGIYQIVLLVSGLVLPRYILTAFGSSYNGLVASLGQFLSVTEVLTMGLAGAARVELYDSLAHDDIKRTSGIIKAVNQYMYKAAGVFLAYMIALLLVYPRLIKSEFSFQEIASLILIIGIGNIIAYVCGYAYNVLLDADNTVYFFTYLKIFLTITNVVISIMLIKVGRSIQTVKLASGIIFAVGPIFLLLAVPKIYNLDKTAPADYSWKKNRKYAAANSVALIIHENTDIVVLTVLTSTKIVSVYTVYNLVIKGLKGVLGVFTTSMEPLFGEMWAKNEIEEMKTTLNHYEFFIGFFCSVSLSCALSLILPFVSLYTKGVTDVEYVLPVFAFITILAELTRCIRIPYVTVVQATGKYKETQIAAFIEAGLNIIISIILTIPFGLVGVMIGTLVANLFRTINFSWFISRRVLDRSMKNTLYLITWTLVNIIINSTLFSLICSILKLNITSWRTWIIGAFIAIALSLIEVMITSSVFYRTDYRWMRQYASKYLDRVHK